MHLLAALREAVLHQVSPDTAAAVLAAVDTFVEQERLRWHQIATHTLPPIEIPPEERMGDLEFKPVARIFSPRLVHAEQAKDFKKVVIEDQPDAGL